VLDIYLSHPTSNQESMHLKHHPGSKQSSNYSLGQHLSSIKDIGGSLAFLVFEVSRFIFYRCFGDFSVDGLGNIRPVKNNGRGVNFQCRKGVSFRVASNNHTKTIKAALLLWCF
jgi:hypothetical protein